MSSDPTLYLWDLRNRMVAVDQTGNDLDIDSNGATSGSVADADDATYGYDSAGQRISQGNGTGTSSQQFLNDKNNFTGYPQILEQTRVVGGVTKRGSR